jgi:hypothetical protein
MLFFLVQVPKQQYIILTHSTGNGVLYSIPFARHKKLMLELLYFAIPLAGITTQNTQRRQWMGGGGASIHAIMKAFGKFMSRTSEVQNHTLNER